MKLILTAEVDHLGAAGDTVEVKDGYGRNFLLPRGLAIVALGPISLAAKVAGDAGKLFGSVTASDVAVAIKKLSLIHI